MTRARTAPLAGATVLAGLSALHLAWAAGSAWPAGDRHELARVMAGRDEVPSTAACMVVGVGLGCAAALVAGAGRDAPAARLARAGLAAGFLARGVAGLTGTTHRLVPWTPQGRFVQLDRRYYGPLCCAIALSAARAAGRHRRQTT
jgi:Protein of unknown function (DUF3995)